MPSSALLARSLCYPWQPRPACCGHRRWSPCHLYRPRQSASAPRGGYYERPRRPSLDSLPGGGVSIVSRGGNLGLPPPPPSAAACALAELQHWLRAPPRAAGPGGETPMHVQRGENKFIHIGLVLFCFFLHLSLILKCIYFGGGNQGDGRGVGLLELCFGQG